MFSMEDYKETESTLRPHFVEHAAVLQLKDTQYELTPELLVDPADVVLAEELLAKIFQATTAFYATEAVDPARETPPAALDEFRFRTLLREMMVGPPAYPSFTAANVIDQNPVYNALKAKGDQLKAAGHLGITGIFICDGGSQILRSTTTHWASFTVEEIIRYFLRQFASVSFVTTLVVRETHWSTWHDRKRSVEAKLYLNPRLKIDSTALAQTIAKMHASLPLPQCTPENAMYELRSTNGMCGRHIGEIQMGGNIKMSARLLLELLAGTKTIQEFEADYTLQPGQNPFHQMLAQGRLISKVTVEHHPEQDDDMVTLEFGEPDPAVSSFRTGGRPK
jgi:hypothetical protein